jgi:hypothetical protein
LIVQEQGKALAARGRGRFFVIPSAFGLVACPFTGGYESAEHGVLGLVDDP